MKKSLAVLSGALALFIWGMVSWTLLPWRRPVMKVLPEETLLRDTMKTVIKDPGYYMFPSDEGPNGRLSQKEWTEKFLAGPTGILVYSPGGKSPMSAWNFIFGFLIQVGLSALVVWLLGLITPSISNYMSRMYFMVVLSVFIWVASDVPLWNWMNYPFGVTMIAFFDRIIGFLLLGTVLHPFLRKT